MLKVYILISVFILCVILCFVFSILTYQDLANSNFNFIASVGRNWQTGPLSDVELGGIDCPSGKEPIFKVFWEGTEPGCLCGSSYKDLKSSGCTSSDEEKSQFCQDIFGIQPIEIKVWKGTKICGKRYGNYLDLKTAKNPTGCEMGYKPCGIIDTLNNVLCHPNGLACPYNGITIIPNGADIPKDKSYTIIPLGLNGNEGKLLFTNENLYGRIVNQFKIDDDVPCISPEFHNRKFTPYLLEKFYEKTPCKISFNDTLYDNSFIKIDSENYSRLYSENKILELLNILPFFKDNFSYSNQPTSLFYKNYFGIDKRCIKDIIDNNLALKEIQSLIKVEELVNSIITCATVAIIAGILGIFVVLIFTIGILCINDKNIFLISYIITGIFFTIPIFVTSIILMKRINSSLIELPILKDPNCTDLTTSLAVTSFSSRIISAKANASALLAFSVISFIINIFNFVFYFKDI